MSSIIAHLPFDRKADYKKKKHSAQMESVRVSAVSPDGKSIRRLYKNAKEKNIYKKTEGND